MMNKNKNQYILFLNASKDKELDVFLILNTKIIDKIIQSGDYKITEYLLKSIEQILKVNKVKYQNLAGIIAVIGSGSFTSLRIIVTVANTLAYSLKIPVIGIKNIKEIINNEKLIKLGLNKLKKAQPFKYISPFYNREPNITIIKK